MEELFVRPRACARMHESPLGTHIDAFIGTLANQGYAKDLLRRAARLVGDFSRWLLRRGLAADGITREGIEAFLRHRQRRRTPRYKDRPTLLRLLTHLGDSSTVVLRVPAPMPTPAQRLEVKYVDYLRREHNLAPSTIHSNRKDHKSLRNAIRFAVAGWHALMTCSACATTSWAVMRATLALAEERCQEAPVSSAPAFGSAKGSYLLCCPWQIQSAVPSRASATGELHGEPSPIDGAAYETE